MDIPELVTLGAREIRGQDLAFTPKTRLWCRLPYPGHPGGCPNAGREGDPGAPACPPRAPFMDHLPEDYRHFYLVWGRLDFAEYRRRMRALDWVKSDRQARCVLYWQGSLKSRLLGAVERICRRGRGEKYVLGCGSGFSSEYLLRNQGPVFSMEAAGLDVFKTLESAGFARGEDFEVKPDRWVMLVCLVCSLRPLDVSLQPPKKQTGLERWTRR